MNKLKLKNIILNIISKNRNGGQLRLIPKWITGSEVKFASYSPVEIPSFLNPNIPAFTNPDIPDFTRPSRPSLTVILYETTLPANNEKTTPVKKSEKSKEVLKSETPATPQQSSGIALLVINFARQFIGKPYTSAGHNPKTGFDCSGYLWYVFTLNNVKIPLNIFQMVKHGTSVSLAEARPGDIIVTPGKGKSGLHVKMITDKSNGKIKVIEAKGHLWGVKESELTQTNNIKSIRRVC